jgi:death-on-curing family protein
MTIYVSGDQLIAFNARVGGSVLNKVAVDAAADRPSAGFGDHEEYPDLVEKAAVLLHGIASTQNFSDGNKRTAWVAMRFFLEINGVSLRQPPRIAAESFVLTVATGLFTVAQVSEWIRQHVPNGRMQIHGGRLSLAALTSPNGLMENIDATEVTITGPGVLILQENVAISGGSIHTGDGNIEAIWWELDPSRTGVIMGAVGVRNCSFSECHFVGTGIAGTADFAHTFFSGMQVD